MTTPKLHSKYNKPNRNQLAQFVRYVINNYIIAVVAVIISNYISNNSDCYGVTRRRLLGMEVCPTTIDPKHPSFMQKLFTLYQFSRYTFAKRLFNRANMQQEELFSKYLHGKVNNQYRSRTLKRILCLRLAIHALRISFKLSSYTP